jgi:hypothetical protein
MPRPKHSRFVSGYVTPEVTQLAYRHLARQEYVESEWQRDPEHRLILHDAGCLRLTQSGMCTCEVTILHVVPRNHPGG